VTTHNIWRDYPKEQIIMGAARALAEWRSKGFPDAHVYFKATCPRCRTRCMFQEPDEMFDFMECSECAATFPFIKGNDMLATSALPKTGQEDA